MTEESESGEAAAEAAMERAKEQTRHTSEPTKNGSDEGVGRVDAIKSALVEIEDGDAPENINVRDARMKALLVGLDDADDLDSVAQQLADHLGDDSVDTAEVSQSDIARLSMRVGLREALPDVREDAEEAARQKALEQETGY